MSSPIYEEDLLNLFTFCGNLQSNDDMLSSCESLAVRLKRTILSTIEHIEQNLIRSWSEAFPSNPETEISNLLDQQRELETSIKQLLNNFKITSFAKSDSVLSHLHEINNLRQEYENKLRNYQQNLTELGENDDDGSKLVLSASEKEKDDSRKLYHENVITYNRKVLELQLLLDYFEQGLIKLDETAEPPVYLYQLLDKYKSICEIPGQSKERRRENNERFDSWKNNLQLPSSTRLPSISPGLDEVPQINLDEANMAPPIDPHEQNVASPPRSSASSVEENIGIRGVERKHIENETLIKNVRQTYEAVRRRNAFIVRVNLITGKYDELQRLNNDVQTLSSQWRRVRPDPQDRTRDRSEPAERRREPRIPDLERSTMKSITELVIAITDAKNKLIDYLSTIDEDIGNIEELQTSLANLRAEMGVNRDEEQLMNAEEQINQDLKELNRKAMKFNVEMRTLRTFIIEKERIVQSKMDELKDKLNQKKLRLEARIAERPPGFINIQD